MRAQTKRTRNGTNKHSPRAPYVRPCCRPLRPGLPKIVIREGRLSDLPIEIGPEYEWDNVALYRVTFRRIFPPGIIGENGPHQRSFLAGSPARALEQLAEEERDYRLMRIEVIEVQPPLARELVAAIREANEELTSEIERRRKLES
jgi:hypothetical protein